ncbi:ester cyclase [Qipengyuania qiaonensis]|uniref:Ester cyclase n=1 Tax=Qipengyuania qiaonensis TaxID=2867240 RepID=A0ABS7J977_9SPHN|nr:ester cyclase [Qipengyuania qiaonensis]MBX7483801.1 ester cyclase [Qipengyuania qiaonensis]
MITPKDLARLFVDIMNGHEASRFAELVTEDYLNHNPAVENGRAGICAFMAHWFETMPDLVVTCEDVLVDGDRVAGRFSYYGTHSGDFVGIPASGATVHMRSIDIWRVENGLFAEHWDELNMLEVFQQMGALPRP